MLLRSSSADRFYQSVYRNCNAILEPDQTQTGTLYLGDMTAAFNTRELKKKGITHVLTVAARLGVSYKTTEITHKCYPALDMETYNLSKYFEDSFKFIDQGLKQGSVLVHCAAGISRSATIVIAYLMRKKNWSYDTASKFVKKKRGVISPNYGFVKQLKAFQTKNLSYNAIY